MTTMWVIRTIIDSQHQWTGENIEDVPYVDLDGERYMRCDGSNLVNVRHIVAIYPTWK